MLRRKLTTAAGVPVLVAASVPKRTKSFLLDIEAAPKGNVIPTGQEVVEQDVYTKMLCSPLRQCILTRGVYPKDLLVQFQLVRNSDGSKAVWTPSATLHPRFREPLTGQSRYIICSKRAVWAVSKSGAHKRWNSYTFSQNIDIQLQSLLSRRIVQELEVYRERICSLPKIATDGSILQCPIVRIPVEHQHEDLDKLGFKLVAILSLRSRPHFSKLQVLEPSGDRKLRPNVIIPVYSLGTLFGPTAIPPSTSLGLADNDSEKPLALQMMWGLDTIVNLFSRRKEQAEMIERNEIVVPSTPLEISQANKKKEVDETVLYGLYEPVSSARPKIPGMARIAPNLNGLLCALWRCRMWLGEGREEYSAKKGIPLGKDVLLEESIERNPLQVPLP